MKKIKEYLNKNIIITIFIILAIFFELFAITYTNCFPFLTRPIYPLLILTFVVIIILLTYKNLIQLIFSTIILITQLVLNTIFIFLYDSNGTVFEWAMYNQRTDATGTLETYEFRYVYIIICSLLIISYLITMIIYLKKTYKIKKKEKKYYSKKQLKILIPIALISVIFIISIPFIETKINNNKGYISKLYSTTVKNYQTIGIISNSIYQVIRGNASVDISNLDNIDKFIYKEKIDTSEYNGISKDNNLILILVESLEWYPFTLYPEKSKILYPNLTKLIENGIVGNNFYQKEKTDVSEALSILGNYPTGKYVNYDFSKNSYPFSLPNLLKYNNDNMIINSFHANYGTFYNRYNLHKSFGFNQLYAIDEMNEYGVIDTWNHKKGERNLDSITFDKMKEIMFPSNNQFFSFIISFSMHGYYGKRNSLQNYYNILKENGINIDENNINDVYLKTYMAALMDFDKGIGTMINYLKDNNILDNTTIILYSDHNTYYNKLSNYAKKIDDKYNTELFHIPFIIYDEKLVDKYIKNNGNNKINKFTTTSDIVPTILDIFGIDGWKNLYFGNSIFTDNESIVYSRNYGFFLTDKFIGYSLKCPLYQDSNISKEDLDYFEKNAKIHLKKLEFIDKIYYSNYFKNHSYKYN